MPLRRNLTIHEKNINFDKYEKFLDTVKEQAIVELRAIVDSQKNLYIARLRKILNSKYTVGKKIKEIEILDIAFGKDIRNTLIEYLEVVTLFSLKEASREIGIKNPKRLSSEINSWIKTTSNLITIKYLAETDLTVSIPGIDYINRVVNQEIIYRTELLFDDIKNKKPELIIRGMEGKALFKGRDLSVKLFNGDINLEADGFNLASIGDILSSEKVVAAQWSAILDAHVCDLCASLDGRIISIDDPDYAFYSPGDLHLGCRCLWAYIKNTERPENRKVDWKTPNIALLGKYAKKDIKDKSQLRIDEDNKEVENNKQELTNRTKRSINRQLKNSGTRKLSQSKKYSKIKRR